MKRELIKNILSSEDYGREVIAAGWIKTRRDSKGGFSFLEINDGSCMGNLQVVADADLSNYEDIKQLFPGASVRVSGILKQSPGSGQAGDFMEISDIDILFLLRLVG